MSLSRELRRSMLTKGVAKKLEDTFYKTINDIKKCTEPMSDFKFENNGKFYDITSLVILCLSLLGTKNDNGFDLVHKHIIDNISKRDYSDEKSKVYLVGANLNNILDKYEECGLYTDISRVLSIARYSNMYKGAVGSYYLDDYFCDEVEDLFAIISESERLKNVYLSTVYSVALDIFSLCMLASDSISDEFLGVYVLMLTLSDDTKIYEFIKICMSYCILHHKKEGEHCVFLEDLSGDILADVGAIGAEYVDLLNLLEYESESHDYIIATDALTDAEYGALELYRVVRIGASLDYIHKLFIVENAKVLRGLKQEGALKEKELSKKNRSISKQLSKMESKLKSKTKELDKVTKALQLSKKNSKEEEYKKKIAELEAKLKTAEDKNIAANNRISTLEERLKNSTVVKTVQNQLPVAISDSVGESKTIEKVEDEISDEVKINAIKDIKFLVVGGKSSWFERLKSYLPNAKHIDIESKGSNYTVPLSTECVIVVTKLVSHKHVTRLETQLSKSVPVIPINVFNMSDVIDSIYTELILKLVNK